jgi:uncharacterized protein YcbK (DUF882 family)
MQDHRSKEPNCKTGVSGLMATSLTTLLLAGLLSGCVGATVDTSLQTAQLQTAGYNDDTSLVQVPADAASAGTGDAYADAVGQAALTAQNTMTIPTPSPLSDQPAIAMALTNDQNPTNQVPAVTALNGVTSETESTAATQPVAVDSATQNTTVQTAGVPIQQTPTDGSTSMTQLQASLEPAPKPKPKTFFELLFQKRSDAKLPAKSTVSTKAAPVMASADPSTTPSIGNSDATALPGVQNSKAIFGIDEDATSDDASMNDEGVQVASVGGFTRSLSATGLILQTDKVKVDCFKPELLALLAVVEKHYGKKVMVTSGYRSPDRNRRAGGVKNSSHIYCKAADIQVEGVNKWDLAKYLRTLENRGGVGTYCRTESVHIDVGTQRDWHHPCRRKKSKA